MEIIKLLVTFAQWLLFYILTPIIIFTRNNMLATFTIIRNNNNLVFISRDEWHAKPPKAIDLMSNPVQFVVIHHSYMPVACHTLDECIDAMQWMQNYHQNNQTWNDIGYSFAVGSDGRVYVGRGWSTVGAHAPNYNNISIGICVIGDWTAKLPPNIQLNAVNQLIEFGIKYGHIHEDYQLVGHRQVREGTECPGECLFNEIMKWSHFEPFPEQQRSRNNNVSLIERPTTDNHNDNDDGNQMNRVKKNIFIKQ